MIGWFRDRLLDAVSTTPTSEQIPFFQYALEQLLRAQKESGREQIPQLPIELAILRICGKESSKEPFESQKKEEEPVLPEVTKTVFDTVPVLSLEQVKEKWPEVYAQIKACNASLPLIMQSCEVSRLDGDHMDLGFEYDLYVQTVNQEKNRLVIEGVLEKVLGRRFRVRAIQSKNKPEQDETIQSLVQEFGGSLI